MPRIPLEPEVEYQFHQELLYCSFACPFRPPRWRFRRAELLFVLNLPKNKRRDDAWVERAYDYHRDVHRRETRRPRSRAPVPVLEPAIEGALELWATTDLLRRWEVEARIVANQAYSEIAARIGISEAVLEAYEALFFNVAESRQAPEYLLRVAIGLRESDGFEITEIQQLWKLLGLVGGPHILDLVMDVFPGPELEPRKDGFAVATTEDADRLGLMVKVLTTPSDKMSWEEKARAWPKLLKRQQRKVDTEATRTVTGPSDALVPVAKSPANRQRTDHRQTAVDRCDDATRKM